MLRKFIRSSAILRGVVGKRLIDRFTILPEYGEEVINVLTHANAKEKVVQSTPTTAIPASMWASKKVEDGVAGKQDSILSERKTLALK